MRKRVQREKRKNVKDCGEDPPEFKEYKNVCSGELESMGAEPLDRFTNNEISEEVLTIQFRWMYSISGRVEKM